jgi:hypothetical protein
VDRIKPESSLQRFAIPAGHAAVESLGATGLDDPTYLLRNGGFLTIVGP